MAKNRKTRKDKIRSAARSQDAIVTNEETQTDTHSLIFTYQLPSAPIRSSNKPATAITHTHISQDLIKTLFITGTIVLAQVLLFVLLQNR